MKYNFSIDKRGSIPSIGGLRGATSFPQYTKSSKFHTYFEMEEERHHTFRPHFCGFLGMYRQIDEYVSLYPIIISSTVNVFLKYQAALHMSHMAFTNNRICRSLSYPSSILRTSLYVALPFVKCYIDDILVFSENRKEHQKHLTMVLKSLVEHGLKLHPSNYTFFYSQVEYLGHVIY